MSPTLTEDTLPAEAASGLRRITYQHEDQQITLILSQQAREACPGEIHPVQDFAHVNQVITNQQLVTACLAIAKAAAATPRLQSL